MGLLAVVRGCGLKNVLNREGMMVTESRFKLVTPSHNKMKLEVLDVKDNIQKRFLMDNLIIQSKNPNQGTDGEKQILRN